MKNLFDTIGVLAPPRRKRPRSAAQIAALKKLHDSPEHKAQLKKLRDAQKGVGLSPEHKAKISNALKCPAQIARLKKLSDNQKGRSRSLETRAKMSKNSSSRRPEVRSKISLALKGHKLSAETRAKISQSITKAIQEGRFPPKSYGINGDFYSAKNKQTLHYRSLLELHWYQLLETLDKVKRYHVEPVIVPYEWEGGIHGYVPDLRVRYTDGTTELIEIKPEGPFFRQNPQNKAKWKAARKWCKTRRIPTVFRVVGYEELAG